jgi:CheY-like chemotaxis protein
MARLVFAEDNEMVRKLITIAMRDSGHEILIAEDGREGLELLRNNRADLLVTDLAMPHMTGLELYDAVKADPELAKLRVVFLTASTQKSLLADAETRAPVAILMKPFSPAQLRAKLEEILATEPP